MKASSALVLQYASAHSPQQCGGALVVAAAYRAAHHHRGHRQLLHVVSLNIALDLLSLPLSTFGEHPCVRVVPVALPQWRHCMASL